MASTVASRQSVRVGSFVQPSATLTLEESATMLWTKVHTNFISSTLPLSSSHLSDFSSRSKLGGRSKQARRCPRQRRPSNTSPHGAHYADASRDRRKSSQTSISCSPFARFAVRAHSARLSPEKLDWRLEPSGKSARCPARFRRRR
jgi:hypothetical protein